MAMQSISGQGALKLKHFEELFSQHFFRLSTYNNKGYGERIMVQS